MAKKSATTKAKNMKTPKNVKSIKSVKTKTIEPNITKTVTKIKPLKTKLSEIKPGIKPSEKFVTKKSTNAVKTAVKTSIKDKKIKIEEALIENFVSMQKVLTNLSVKFDNLANQISKLLELLEISAKSFVEKQKNMDSEDKEFVNKLNILLDQNKTIARGLTLLEQKMRGGYGNTGVQATTYSPVPSLHTQRPQLNPSIKPVSMNRFSTSPEPKTTEESDEENKKIKPKPLPRI